MNYDDPMNTLSYLSVLLLVAAIFLDDRVVRVICVVGAVTCAIVLALIDVEVIGR